MYNGLILLGDQESGSYWDHMTGSCVTGPLKGYKLKEFPLLQMNVSQALSSYSDIQVAISELPWTARIIAFFMEWSRKSQRGFLPPVFKKTMGKEDVRRRLMDTGLGIWTNATHRFYPVECLQKHGGALIDEIDGRKVLIFINPSSNIPDAFYTCATRCAWRDNLLTLDTGEIVRDGTLCDRDGIPQGSDRPRQLFLRWYGFSYTFPGCEVYKG
jgi:hypothetical protein